ncbi:hypothetical protein BDV09DRAFT_70569 [Aspergillus tetrazonus]
MLLRCEIYSKGHSLMMIDIFSKSAAAPTIAKKQLQLDIFLFHSILFFFFPGGAILHSVRRYGPIANRARINQSTSCKSSTLYSHYSGCLPLVQSPQGWDRWFCKERWLNQTVKVSRDQRATAQRPGRITPQFYVSSANGKGGAIKTERRYLLFSSASQMLRCSGHTKDTVRH